MRLVARHQRHCFAEAEDLPDAAHVERQVLVDRHAPARQHRVQRRVVVDRRSPHVQRRIEQEQRVPAALDVRLDRVRLRLHVVVLRPRDHQHGAVARDRDPKVAHVSIVRGEEDAIIRRNARQNQGLHLEIFQERIQRCGKESRVLGLEDEVVILHRSQDLDNWLAPHAVVETVLDLGVEVRSPAAEVIVDVHDRNSCF